MKGSNIDIAVTSRSFSRHPVLRKELANLYPSARFNDKGKSMDGEELIAFLRGAERAITALEPLGDAEFDQLPELRVVSKFGVGVDMIDLEAMQKHDVKLGWTPGVNRHSVAELTVMMMIALLHRVPEALETVGKGQWQQIRGRQLGEKTIGIIGCGHVGKLLCTYLKPYGCKILAHDILDFPEFYQKNDVTPANLETVLQSSDVVTLHVPLNSSSRQILSRERMSLMRQGAVLINAARGGLVDEQALFDMLDSGHLAGAGLDVFAEEPPVDRRLIELPNVMVTPHIGGSTEEAVLAMGRAAIRGLDEYGDPLVVAANA